MSRSPLARRGLLTLFLLSLVTALVTAATVPANAASGRHHWRLPAPTARPAAVAPALPGTGTVTQGTGCLVAARPLANFSAVSVVPCRDDLALQWTATAPSGSGALAAGNNFCLDSYTSVANGVWPVRLYSCNGTAAQTWTRLSEGQLRNGASGLCLTQGAAGSLLMSSCTPVAAQRWTLPDGRLRPGTVLFADDFSGTAGRAPRGDAWAEWSACTYNPTAAFGRIGCAPDAKLDGQGHLAVSATPTKGSAVRSTVGFTYGVFSAWIKLPAGPGYWPAFWMLNSPQDGRAVDQVGEVDAMEAYTTWPDTSHAMSHIWGSGAQPTPTAHDTDRYCTTGKNLSADFHQYSVKVAPGPLGTGQITFYVDGAQCGAPASPASFGGAWAFGPKQPRPLWMILDLAVGGADGRQATPTAPAIMLVDRVEVRGL